MGSVVVDTWGYDAAFMIAGTVGVCCAFITIFLRQPKLPQPQGRTPGQDEREPAALVHD
jgi:hypothetical protein